ncbi:MAG: 16S rRNA pseudouridine(516) synthase, partial [Clostridia bacterium]|nr:16S rRNA pseudouridine(516) synthase [Clostridia bacterium]
ILTNNGQLAHRMLSPKRHVDKVYFFGARDALTDDDIQRLCEGVDIGEGYITKPAKVEMIEDKLGYITLTEGKYHQIKRMLEAVGNKITILERIDFAGVVLDNTLKRGEWRYLTDKEVDALLRSAKQ